MNSHRLTVITLLLAVSNLSAATLYVSLGSTNPSPPYATWATAATSIQAAVDAAAAGDLIRVTNGVYSQAVTVEKPVAVRSMNGAQFTAIVGYGDAACVQLTNGASLTGFTLRKGSSGCCNGVVVGIGWFIWPFSSTNGCLTNCVITGGNVPGGNGTDGFGGGVIGCTLYDCVLTGNWASYGGGGAAYCTLYNCTLAGNSVTAYGGGTLACTLYNCIDCFNTGYYANDYSSTLNSCLTDSDPLFVDYATGNLRLQSNSPCINAGNNAFVPVPPGKDLDGRPRIAGGTVDIGAYEFQPGVSGAFIGWLQQYGLPTGGSADFADADGDGMNNWQEWVCGTCPTNRLSALCLLSATPQGPNVTVSWQSVAGVNYFLARSANPAAPFAFVATNIIGQAGATACTDTTATGAGPFFYRVGVNCP